MMMAVGFPEAMASFGVAVVLVFGVCWAGYCITSIARAANALERIADALEKEPQGDAVAMREALKAARSFVVNLEIEPFSHLDEVASELLARIDVALSAPPRNCDKALGEEGGIDKQ